MRYSDFDENFEDGVFVIPSDKKVKVRALISYCKENNKSISDLSEDEMSNFIVYDK